MQTPRDYLVSLGLAKAGARGRFSREANEALAKAKAEGKEFAEASPPKTSTLRKSPHRFMTDDDSQRSSIVKIEPKIKHNVNAAAVRKWAAEKGVVTSERGRLSGDLVQQYVDAHKDNPQAMLEPKPAGVKEVLKEAPRTKFAEKYEALDIDGKSKIVKTSRDVCNHCMWSISHCQCADGPHTISIIDTVTFLRLAAVA